MLKPFYQVSETEYVFEICKKIILAKDYNQIENLEEYLSYICADGSLKRTLNNINEILVFYIYYVIFSDEDRKRSLGFKRLITAYNTEIVTPFFTDNIVEKELNIKKGTESDNEDIRRFKANKNIFYKFYLDQESPYPEVSLEESKKILHDFYANHKDRIFNNELLGVLVIYNDIMQSKNLSAFQKDKFDNSLMRVISNVCTTNLNQNEETFFRISHTMDENCLSESDNQLNMAD